MATLSYQNAKATGVALTLSAASAGGDALTAADRGGLYVYNADTTATTVTLVTPGNDEYGQPRPDPTFSVPASGHAVFGPLPVDLKDPATGLVSVTYSKVTSLSVAALTF